MPVWVTVTSLSAALSSWLALTVTVCGWFQLEGVKSSSSWLKVSVFVGLAASVTVTVLSLRGSVASASV